MRLEIHILLAILLLLFAYIVFRRIVRRDYHDRGQLGAVTSIMQLSVFVGYFSFPYLFNPPEWVWFWNLSGSAPQALQLLGFGLICMGFFAAFGAMAWFGMGKAFGVIVEGITTQGPYKISRNPQILGGYLFTSKHSLTINLVLRDHYTQNTDWKCSSSSHTGKASLRIIFIN